MLKNRDINLYRILILPYPSEFINLFLKNLQHFFNYAKSAPKSAFTYLCLICSYHGRAMRNSSDFRRKSRTPPTICVFIFTS